MAYYSIFPESDTTLYSHPDRAEMNAGGDEILEILKERGRTNNKLYPAQWNWDSGFIALGYSYFNLNFALRELNTLLDGQWKDGMVPHILFHNTKTNYYPNYTAWNCGNKIHSSGITQPPILASILRIIIERKKFSKEDVQSSFKSSLPNNVSNTECLGFSQRTSFGEVYKEQPNNSNNFGDKSSPNREEETQTQNWWQTQSELCGVPNGVSFELHEDRVNRIQALGNSIVPQIAQLIAESILTAEKDDNE